MLSHRRYRATKAMGYTKLPVVIEKFASPEAEMERLLRENENRGKTPEQQIREGMTWEPIEEQKAKIRQQEQNFGRTQLRENFPQVEDGRVRDVIARRVGLGSGKTYESCSAINSPGAIATVCCKLATDDIRIAKDVEIHQELIQLNL